MNQQATVVQQTAGSAAVRNIILFTLLVNGLAWLGPLLGGDPTSGARLLWGWPHCFRPNHEIFAAR
ncbi:MAG: hypothetical protein R2932_42290 [Caldilineaceae bacterium]